MIKKLIHTFHTQPSYREELKKMLGDAQTDNTVSFLKLTFCYNTYLNGYGISGETYFYFVGEIFYLLSI